MPRPIREWQERATRKWIGDKKKDFLCVATPGAGKTRFASEVVKASGVKKILVICPTEYLKEQWVYAAKRDAGLELDHTATTRNLQQRGLRGIDGIVVTYAHMAVLEATETLARLVAREPTLVVVDEIHHAGESLAWGEALCAVGEAAAYRLLLSGTPFRSDSNPIPFVSYDSDRKSIADFQYGYGEAISNRVCAPVWFPNYEGTMEWIRDGGRMRAQFKDPLEEQAARDRLRTALEPYSPYVLQLLRGADEQISEVRRSFSRAGGLVIAKDQAHAYQLAEILSGITGRNPALAISDEGPEANDAIKRFNGSMERWLVSCKMVSEGVDIERLKVGVFLSDIKTPLFFRQFVGRFVRGTTHAHVFMPADQDLRNYALEIEEERNHELGKEEEVMARAESTPSAGTQPPDFNPLDATQPERASTIGRGEEYASAEVERAIRAMNAVGVELDIDQVIRLFRAYQGLQEEPMQTEAEFGNPEAVERQRLRVQIGNLVSRLHYRTRVPFKDIHLRWIEAGGSQHDGAPAKELHAKREWLIRCLQANAIVPVERW